MVKTRLLHVSSVQSLSCIQLFESPWTAARQASLSITNSQSFPKPMSIDLVIPSNHLILCRPLLLHSIFPSSRVFSNESALPIRWPKYWSFSFSISLSKEYSGLISIRIDWLDLLAVQETLNSLLQHEVMGPDAMILVFWMLSFKPTFSLSSFSLFSFSSNFKPNWFYLEIVIDGQTYTVNTMEANCL